MSRPGDVHFQERGEHGRLDRMKLKRLQLTVVRQSTHCTWVGGQQPVVSVNADEDPLPLGKWQDGLQTVDEMLVKDKGHPYTAQALIEAARIAKSHGQPDRGAVYLQRYLEDYPNSPFADRIRKEREEMLK